MAKNADLLPSRVITQEEIQIVMDRLDCRGWINLDTLVRDLGISRRRLQMIAHSSDGGIISGQQGYALHSQATLEECEHAANWLDSQAEDMKARARAIRGKTALRSYRVGIADGQRLMAF